MGRGISGPRCWKSHLFPYVLEVSGMFGIPGAFKPPSVGDQLIRTTAPSIVNVPDERRLMLALASMATLGARRTSS